MTVYSDFVKTWASDHNLSYGCAVSQPQIKSDYLKFKAGEPYGEFETNLNPRKKREPVMEEMELNPRRKKVKPKPEPVLLEPKDDRPNISEQQQANLKKNLGAKEETYKNLIELLKKGNMSYEDFLKKKSEALKEIESLLNYLVETAKKYKDGAKLLQPYINIFEVEISDSIESIIYTNETELITYFLNLKEINETKSKDVSNQYGELEKIKSLIKSKKYKNLIQKRLDKLQEIFDKLSKKVQLSNQEEKCLELFKKLNIVTRTDFNKQILKFKKEARDKGIQEFEKYPPYVELVNCRGILENELLKNPQQAKQPAPVAPVVPVAPKAKPLLLNYLSREELYKLIEEKATPINLPVEKSSKTSIEIIEMEGKNIIEKIIEQIKNLISKIPDRTKSENKKAKTELYLKVLNIMDKMKEKQKSSSKELSDILNIYIKKIDKLHSDISVIAPSSYKSRSDLKKYL